MKNYEMAIIRDDGDGRSEWDEDEFDGICEAFGDKCDTASAHRDVITIDGAVDKMAHLSGMGFYIAARFPVRHYSITWL